MYKKSFLITLAFTLGTLVSYSQGDRFEERKDRLEQKKIAYITTELDMTTEQAQRFWPIYNKYTEELSESRNGNRSKQKEEADLSDAEAESLISTMLENEEKKIQLKKEYVGQLKNVLDNRQILKLMNTEKKFRKEILERYKKRRNKGDKKEGKREEKVN